ncbi:viral IAP-associated factor homolog [Capsicum annuum]|uniref:viral IAP-associated factor homolog n=1 Tax=Capsicum annuum TaxID=4072 RepID=UPI001FB15F5F|nr:viral IAP-associated factor homolog [Capsicum annuum]
MEYEPYLILHLDRQRAFRAFEFGNAHHGQGPDSDRDSLLLEVSLQCKQNKQWSWIVWMKRIAEMREVAKIVRFGSVTPISGADFVLEVSQAPEDVWVVVLLYKDGYSDCQILLQCLDELVTKYPATKFVKIISTDCIQNYPDCNLPTVLVYHNGALKSNYVGVHSFGRRCTPEGITLTLCQSDPVLNDGRSKKEQSREAVLERVRERFLEKVVERVSSSEIMFASFAGFDEI